MLYIIFLQQIHVVHVTVRFILLQLQLQSFYTPAKEKRRQRVNYIQLGRMAGISFDISRAGPPLEEFKDDCVDGSFVKDSMVVPKGP